MTDERFDVLIVGGGPAGLQAALTLGRARKRVLVADGGPRRNVTAVHMHNFVSRDGIAPQDFRREAWAQLAQYPNVSRRDEPVDAITGRRGDFSTGTIRARRVLLATGVVDQPPDIEGLAAFWGHSVFQCPYCHGWEVKDEPLGVLGGQVVSDVYETGTKKRTYVRAGGEEIAWQNGDSGGSVVFQAADAAGMSLRSTEPNGDIFDAQGSESSPAELDPLTEWFVLAWDAFAAPQFPYDEALQLARVVGVDMERDLIGNLAEKKASDVLLWDSHTRAANGKLGPADGSRTLLDALHHAAQRGQQATLQAAVEQLKHHRLDQQPAFLMALEAVLEVLPPSRQFTGFDPGKALAPAASDFEALENLRRLAFGEQVPPPRQLALPHVPPR
mgnify:CR=1 FL=1